MTSSSPSQAHEIAASAQHAMADAMPHIVWLAAHDGSPTYFNRAWAEYTGLDFHETLRLGAESVLHPDDRDQVVAMFRASRPSGAPLEATYRLRRASDGSYRWHTARVGPLRDRDGQVVGWVGTAIDIDEQRRVSDEQRFLIEAAKVLGTSLDFSQTLRDVGKLVVPHIADWYAIDLLTPGGTFERLAVAHVDPLKVELAREIWQRWPPKPEDPGGVYGVARSRQPEMHEDIPDELLVQSIADPELLAIMRALGLRSSMCVPLIARDQVLGALSLVSAESGRRYGERDLGFALKLASRIAMAIDNAQLYAVATQARTAAEAMAAEIAEQSRTVEGALLAMRAERDAALARLPTTAKEPARP